MDNQQNTNITKAKNTGIVGALIFLVVALLAVAGLVLLLVMPELSADLVKTAHQHDILVAGLGAIAAIFTFLAVIFIVIGGKAADAANKRAEEELAEEMAEDNCENCKVGEEVVESIRNVGEVVTKHPVASSVAAVAAVVVPTVAACAITKASEERRRKKKRETIKDLIRTLLD